MAERPTTSWRRGIAEEAEELAAGTLDPDCACMAGLFPEELLVATDAVLDTFEAELPALPEADDAQVFAMVERVVLALNVVTPTTSAPSKPTSARRCATPSTRPSPSMASTS
ncbi:hypothetical protein ACFXKS_28855 [Streptomyces scopuliridis]|uniref:hypothetical protein n=1 Tax=Streptomyces scopuliridis TaxID=452529 RepID=UPI003698FE28